MLNNDNDNNDNSYLNYESVMLKYNIDNYPKNNIDSNVGLDNNLFSSSQGEANNAQQSQGQGEANNVQQSQGQGEANNVQQSLGQGEANNVQQSQGQSEANNAQASLNGNDAQNRQPTSRQKVDNAIDGAGSEALQKLGLPKNLSDNAIKSNGGALNPGNLPGNKMINNAARNGLAKTLDGSNKSSSGSSGTTKSNMSNNVAKNAAKKAASAVNPALGALAKSKVGDKFIDKALSKRKPGIGIPGIPGIPKLNPLSNNEDSNKKNSSNEMSEPSEGSFEKLTGFKPKTVGIILGIFGPILPIFIIILVVSSVGIIKPSSIDMGTSTVDIENKSTDNYDESHVEDKTNSDTGYLDIFNDNNNSSVVNVALVANGSELNKDLLNDFIGNKNLCSEEEKCSSTVTDRFFNKIYDVYYLYLSKYEVKLDVVLLLSTIFSKNEDFDYSAYLSDYDRKYLVESDWNPSDVMPLDWEYDYESQDNYLVSNDSSIDIQVLAKNMVSKSGDNYKLDLDKYNDFLLEYLEKKYYLGRVTANPTRSNGPSYETDKKPGVLTRVKKKSTSSSSSSSDVNSSNVIDRLNEIALGEVGNGSSKYLSYFSASGDWCGYFVSWLFDQVDNKNLHFITPDGGAGEIPRATLRNNLGGTWLEDECHDSSTVPQAGDIILFDPYISGQYISYPNNGYDQYYSSHVGYVYKVDDEKVYTVEGNSSDQVRKREYSRNHCNNPNFQGINGYFRPDYSKNNQKQNVASNGDYTNSDNDVVNKLNEIAISQKGNGGQKYWSSMNYGATEWCAIFVSWLFKQVSSDKTYFIPYAGAGDIPRYSVPKGYGTWLEDECSDSSTVPRAGDLILFTPTIVPVDKYTSRHIGYVYKVDDEKVYTVEGNTGTYDCTTSYVDLREYDRKNCTINGYYRPNY